MKIAIDCRKIKDGGIGTYLKNLLEQWHSMSAPAKFYLFCLSEDADLIPAGLGEVITHDVAKYSVAELFSFARPLANIKPDLFFTPHYTLPFRLPCPSVITVHDLIHLRFPSNVSLLGKIYARWMITNACNRSSIILTVSGYSKSDIISLSEKWGKKIRIAPPGVNRNIFKAYPQSDIAHFKATYSLPAEFILYVGALKRHKNPQALITLVNKLRIPMVIATQESTAVREVILSGVEDNKLVNVLNISDEKQMALLYNSARMLIHPALYEGFGLPPIEAMACGLPVVCSMAASLSEVVGDAALTFDPTDFETMLEQVNLCWRDANLRDILIAKGAVRAGQFGWDKPASEIFKVFSEVMRK